jgi:tyrosine-protein kinase Etk/Wzc
MLLLLLNDRLRITLITISSLLLGVCIAFLLKPTFTATATFLPPQQEQSTVSALMGQFGSMAGLGGAGGLLKNPADIYVAMITSRTIADRMIERFHLQALYMTSKMGVTREILESNITAEAGRDGLIEINVKDTDPRRASELANGLIDELYHLTATLSTNEASRRRLFYDRQLDDERSALAAAEEDLRTTQENTGLIQLGTQAEQVIHNVADLRAQISSREVELQSMRTYATDENPNVTRLQEEIRELEQQLTALGGNQQRIPPGNIEVSTGQFPERGLQYARKLREVTYHAALLDLIAKEREGARIDESKSTPPVEVVDHAVPPDTKSGPPRTLIIIGLGVIGFCVACFWAFLSQALVRKQQNPNWAAKLNRLRAALRSGLRPSGQAENIEAGSVKQ